MFCPLNKKGDFKKVFEQGTKFSSHYLVMYALPNGLTFSRLGLSVSKKIGIAVVRNRIKRRLREAFRRLLPDRPLHYDFIIVARQASVEAGFDALNKQIFKFLSRLDNEKNSNRSH